MSVRTTLKVASKILALHPRTILRATSRKVNPYWAEGHDCPLDTADLSRAFKVKPMRMDAVFVDNKPLLKPADAAKFLNLHPRTFRAYNYEAVVRNGHVVRFSADMLKAEYKKRLDEKEAKELASIL